MGLKRGFLTPEDLEHFFIEAGISTDLAKTHAAMFADEKPTIESLQMLDRLILKELGVILMGEALCILQQAKETTTQATRVQALAAKPPHPNLEMTLEQFRKLWIDWEVFTRTTNLPRSQANIHLYSCADEAMQNAITDTHPNFFTINANKQRDMVEVLVTQRSNPIIHHLAFASLSQNEDEPIQN